MSDKEILEMAAKAAGIHDAVYSDGVLRDMYDPRDGQAGIEVNHQNPRWKFLALDDVWNPLTDDGDALRLAAQLDVFGSRDDLLKFYSWMADALVVVDDKAAAFRRAITIYAAEIAKQNPA